MLSVWEKAFEDRSVAHDSRVCGSSSVLSKTSYDDWKLAHQDANQYCMHTYAC